MLVRFTRLTNERHRFEIVRDDNVSEARELETRSTLLHDLSHYAVEVEAGLTSSALYGLASETTSIPFTQAPCSRNCMPSIVAL